MDDVIAIPTGSTTTGKHTEKPTGSTTIPTQKLITVTSNLSIPTRSTTSEVHNVTGMTTAPQKSTPGNNSNTPVLSANVPNDADYDG
ncbi:hypothetical protein Tco_0596802 [Tanacetum coccineum]